jgi:hypothetical protein
MYIIKIQQKSPARNTQSWLFLQAEYGFFELIMAGKNKDTFQHPPLKRGAILKTLSPEGRGQG